MAFILEPKTIHPDRDVKAQMRARIPTAFLYTAGRHIGMGG